MARPRKDLRPDLFTTAELALAGGMSPRNFALLQQRSLAPASAGGGGQGSHRVWRTDGVQRTAVIGGLHACGVELFLAARMGNEVAEMLEAAYGNIPSGLDRYLQKPLNPRSPSFPWAKSDNDPPISDSFWLHHLLRMKTDIYVPGAALAGDFVMEIVDRQYVFVGVIVGDPNLHKADLRPECRIIGWERGAQAIVRPVSLELGKIDDSPEVSERAKRIGDEFCAARRNAVGLIRVNLSLAIRNALDAIHDHRLAAASNYTWQPSRVTPDRYAGSDVEGRPLNPSHPWNANLPPEKRAARLREIEKYVNAREVHEEGDSMDTS